MNYIEDMILDVASRLYTDGNTKVTYKGMEFGFQEVEYANPMDFSSMTMISLITPMDFSRDMDFRCGVTYESTYGKNSRTTYLNRSKACMELAKEFVTKFLPKVDFSLKKDMHNREIEEILEVLE